jgi:uncharacterized protein YceK
MSRLFFLLLPVLAFALSGCGTFSDSFCGPAGPGYDYVYYRGVRFDALAIKEGGPMVLMAADLPFSAVADTLLVPYLAYNQLTNPRPTWSSSIMDDQAKNEPSKVDPHQPPTPK